MKRTKNMDLLPLAALLLGCGGWALRAGLYNLALDEKNLLVREHPLQWGLWIWMAAAAAVVLVLSRKSGQTGGVAVDLADGLGHFLAAAGILAAVLDPWNLQLTAVSRLWKATGIAGGVMLLWGGLCRLRGKKPFFGGFVFSCVFFALHLVGNYQQWCSDPQMQNYVFAFLGAICLMLYAYFRAESCARATNVMLMRAAGALAVCCCLTAIPQNQDLYLYLGCALWAAAGLTGYRAPSEEKAEEPHDPA